MTEILLIRHGETDWNVEKRLQGHLDISLNAEGERQAAALGKVLLGETLDAVIASDLQRALKTAESIAMPRGMRVHIEPELRERCYGAFEGLCYREIRERYPQAYVMWQSRDVDARYPEGARSAETLREFFARSINAVIRLATAYRHKKIAIVSHGGVIDCIYRAATDMDLTPPRNFEIKNAGINRLLWNGDALQIQSWSDTRHLNALALDEVDE